MHYLHARTVKLHVSFTLVGEYNQVVREHKFCCHKVSGKDYVSAILINLSALRCLRGEFKELMRIRSAIQIIFLEKEKNEDFFISLLPDLSSIITSVETVRKYLFTLTSVETVKKCVVRYFIWDCSCSLTCNLSVVDRPPISFNAKGLNALQSWLHTKTDS